MSDNLETTMKVSRRNLDRLSGLKPEFQKLDPDRFFSNNLVLDKLLDCYHSIESRYVKKEVYDSLFAEKLELKNIVEKLQGELVDKDKFLVEKIAGLKQELQNKQKEIHVLQDKLKQSFLNVEQVTKDLDGQVVENKQIEKKFFDTKFLFEKLEKENLELKYLLENNYLHKNYLPLYFRLIDFIVTHRRKWYSVDFLSKKLKFDTGTIKEIVLSCEKFSPFVTRIENNVCFVAYQRK